MYFIGEKILRKFEKKDDDLVIMHFTDTSLTVPKYICGYFLDLFNFSFARSAFKFASRCFKHSKEDFRTLAINYFKDIIKGENGLSIPVDVYVIKEENGIYTLAFSFNRLRSFDEKVEILAEKYKRIEYEKENELFEERKRQREWKEKNLTKAEKLLLKEIREIKNILRRRSE